MKKLLLFTLLFISVTVFSQTEKNKILLSGSTNASYLFSSTESSDYKTTNIIISPAIGFFTSNNLVLGISSLYKNSKVKNNNYDSKSTSFGISPFLRYYTPKENRNSKFFVQIEGGYMENNNISGSVISGSFGLSFFFNQHVSFDIEGVYAHTVIEDNTINSIELDLGLSVYLGKTKE